MHFYSTFVAFNVILIVTLRITEHDMNIDLLFYSKHTWTLALSFNILYEKHRLLFNW